jgi:hypothetical protein
MEPVNLAPGLWVLDDILRLPGLRFPVRSAIFQLQSGSLLVLSPLPRIGEAAAAVSALGPVAAVVATSALHHLGLRAARLAFPGARVFGPPALKSKLRGQPMPEALVDAAENPWTGTMELIPIEGMPRLAETAFFHRSSGTLWLTDLCFNIRRSDHAPTRLLMRLNGAWDRFGPSRVSRSLVRDGRALRRSVERMLALKPTRLLPAHGDPVEERATEVLSAAFAHLPR